MIGDQPIPVFETGQISLSCTPHQPRLRGSGAHNGNRTRDLALTKVRFASETIALPTEPCGQYALKGRGERI
jgi:hypothetical protein